MKVQKIAHALKNCSAKIKSISASKVKSAEEADLHISKNIKKLQTDSRAHLITPKNTPAAFSPRTNLMSPIYSKQNMGVANVNSAKNLPKTNSARILSVNKDKATHLPSGIREEKIKEAKIKLAQGYYSRYEVYSKVAEKIIDILI